jgi:putative membrane protein
MKFGTVFSAVSGVAGAGLAVWLLQEYGVDRVFAAILGSGWGFLWVVLFHCGEVALSAAAWHALSEGAPDRPRFGRFVLIRWIREAVNNLLPVAQIGGEVVAARLFKRDGVALPRAVAWPTADLTVEMLTQIVFTVLGLYLLWVGGESEELLHSIAAGLIGATAIALAVFGAQLAGVARALERGLVRFGEKFGLAGLGKIEGLHDALSSIYRSRRRVLRACFWHFCCWVAGGVGIWVMLWSIDVHVSLRAALVIEALGQAIRALGFAVPGALGVQEGALILVAGLYGVPPEMALALSIVRRLREVVHGVPALLVWQRLESRADRAAMLVPEAAE